MDGRIVAVLILSLVFLGAAACDDIRCAEVAAHPVDEARGCLLPARPIPELQACTPYPPTRGIRIACFVDRQGTLHLASIGDSSRLAGAGWRYSGGTGAQSLSQEETQRCADAMSSIGFPEPAAACAP
ncbi:MAG: hypothetical protein ABUR63_09850 [Verrucomicrobiota bacterium]